MFLFTPKLNLPSCLTILYRIFIANFLYFFSYFYFIHIVCLCYIIQSTRMKFRFAIVIIPNLMYSFAKLFFDIKNYLYYIHQQIFIHWITDCICTWIIKSITNTHKPLSSVSLTELQQCRGNLLFYEIAFI